LPTISCRAYTGSPIASGSCGCFGHAQGRRRRACGPSVCVHEARTEGLRVYLGPLGHRTVRRELKAHADRVL
jgi:hypothetical protein